MAGAEGFEPPSSVLETDSLAIELTPLSKSECLARSLTRPRLFYFAVRGMFTALAAELVELQPFGRGLAILGGGVVAVLAISALKLTDFAGHCFPL
jgi:hypothetical protein